MIKEGVMAEEKYVSRHREVEFKFNAGAISLKDYMAFAESLNPVEFIEASSWDHYFSGATDKFDFEFIRYRMGNRPEMTTKVKLNNKNNNDRIEIDVPLDPNRCTYSDVEAFCNQLGFTLNVSIYKVCYIHYFENVSSVYYIVFDEEMKEKGRFIEIESRKDIDHGSIENALATAKKFEKELEKLGITPQHRIKKSQWELNRRGKSG